MNTTELIQEVSVKGVDIDKFVRLAISEDHIRGEIIKQMVTHPHIMVYYHCYYVASRASQERPELFYQYWPEIVSLLKHKNSYHRDFALTILANLTQADQGNLFSKIFYDYFEHINDEKFMTGQCCVQNSIKILRNKPELQEQIIALLLDMAPCACAASARDEYARCLRGRRCLSWFGQASRHCGGRRQHRHPIPP
jgi:hypothetical protein